MKTDNELIAEFMGWTRNTEINKRSRIQWTHPDHSTKLSDTLWIPTTPENMKYDTSWDWLMPVVEKIEFELGYCVNIFYHACDIETISGDTIIHTVSSETKIKAVYEVVLKFIKWHNSQQK